MGARNWGAARKVLNIFMRTVAYTGPLEEISGLTRLLSVLEVPLDSQVAEKLCSDAAMHEFPPWDAIKRLTPEVNRSYQEAAAQVAARKGVHRADLDVYYWRS